MTHTLIFRKPGKTRRSYSNLMTPVNNIFPDITPLESGCNRPLKMSFEDQLNILVYFHLEEHHSGRHLLQVLKEEDFARQCIAPAGGIEKSSFFEDISSRGLQQMAVQPLQAVRHDQQKPRRGSGYRYFRPHELSTRSRFLLAQRKASPDRNGG